MRRLLVIGLVALVGCNEPGGRFFTTEAAKQAEALCAPHGGIERAWTRDEYNGTERGATWIGVSVAAKCKNGVTVGGNQVFR